MILNLKTGSFISDQFIVFSAIFFAVDFVTDQLYFQKCDFEKDQCGWMNVANTADDFDWERAQAETLSYGTGPIVDHTLGSSDG